MVAAWAEFAGDRVPLENRPRSWLESDAKPPKKTAFTAFRDEFLNTPAPTLVRGLRRWPRPFILRVFHNLPV